MTERIQSQHTANQPGAGTPDRADSTTGALHEAASTADGGNFHGSEELQADSERVTAHIDRAAAAVGALAQPQAVGPDVSRAIDPGSVEDADGLTLRCRGFTGEGEPEQEKKGGLGYSPCIVTTGEQPESGEPMIDPGIPTRGPEEQGTGRPQENCFPNLADGTVESPAPTPESGDATVNALRAIIGTLH